MPWQWVRAFIPEPPAPEGQGCLGTVGGLLFLYLIGYIIVESKPYKLKHRIDYSLDKSSQSTSPSKDLILDQPYSDDHTISLLSQLISNGSISDTFDLYYEWKSIFKIVNNGNDEFTENDIEHRQRSNFMTAIKSLKPNQIIKSTTSKIINLPEYNFLDSCFQVEVPSSLSFDDLAGKGKLKGAYRVSLLNFNKYKPLYIEHSRAKQFVVSNSKYWRNREIIMSIDINTYSIPPSILKYNTNIKKSNKYVVGLISSVKLIGYADTIIWSVKDSIDLYLRSPCEMLSTTLTQKFIVDNIKLNNRIVFNQENIEDNCFDLSGHWQIHSIEKPGNYQNIMIVQIGDSLFIQGESWYGNGTISAGRGEYTWTESNNTNGTTYFAYSECGYLHLVSSSINDTLSFVGKQERANEPRMAELMNSRLRATSLSSTKESNSNMLVFYTLNDSTIDVVISTPNYISRHQEYYLNFVVGSEIKFSEKILLNSPLSKYRYPYNKHSLHEINMQIKLGSSTMLSEYVNAQIIEKGKIYTFIISKCVHC